MYFEIVQLPN